MFGSSKELSLETPLHPKPSDERLRFRLMPRRHADVVGEPAAGVARPVDKNKEELRPVIGSALQYVVHLRLEIRLRILVEEVPVALVHVDTRRRDVLNSVEIPQRDIALV